MRHGRFDRTLTKVTPLITVGGRTDSGGDRLSGPLPFGIPIPWRVVGHRYPFRRRKTSLTRSPISFVSSCFLLGKRERMTVPFLIRVMIN